MNARRHTLGIALVAIAGLLLLAGCGGQVNGPGAGSAGSTDLASTSQPTSTSQPVSTSQPTSVAETVATGSAAPFQFDFDNGPLVLGALKPVNTLGEAGAFLNQDLTPLTALGVPIKIEVAASGGTLEMQWIDPKSGGSFWVGMTRFKGISDAAVDNDLDQLVADCACGSRVAVGPVSGVAVHQPGGPYSVYWARGSAQYSVQSIRIDGAAVLAIAADVATRFGP